MIFYTENDLVPEECLLIVSKEISNIVGLSSIGIILFSTKIDENLDYSYENCRRCTFKELQRKISDEIKTIKTRIIEVEQMNETPPTDSLDHPKRLEDVLTRLINCLIIVDRYC
jgi:hypothetical protein